MKIKTTLIKIGNSRGIIIPKKMIEATNLTKVVTIEAVDSGILLSPFPKTLRLCWDQAFKTMHKNNDDKLTISEATDNHLLSDLQW
jgi:antitoxin MazE